jgi:hypothetical protein
LKDYLLWTIDASGGPLFRKKWVKNFLLNRSFVGVQGAVFQKSPLANGPHCFGGIAGG